MADEDRSPADTLMERLSREPYRFDFFQAVRRLECAAARKSRVGDSIRPSHDPVRFCQKPRLHFAPSTIASFQPAGGGTPARMFVHFFGLLGPNGPMPLHLTEYVCGRIHSHHDETLARFLDVFHHRMISFFYLAWAGARKTVNYERGEADRFSNFIGSLFGVGMPALQGRDSTPDVAKLHYSGLLAGRTSSAAGLRALLGDYFQVPVDIEQFVGEWLQMPPGSRCRLGVPSAPGSLGEDLVIGDRVWECQHKFRIRMGPLDLRQFLRMLPSGDGLPELAAWVRNYVGSVLAWEVQLVLKAEEIPELKLGGPNGLGWSTWLKTSPLPEDADQVVIESRQIEDGAHR